MPRSEQANQQIREQRRARILAGAAEVFARKGLAATRIADIAAAAAMSQGLVYHYFDSKDDLFAVLIEHVLADVVELAGQARARPGSPLDRLRWFTACMVPHQYQQPAYAMVIAHALTNEAVPPAVREMARRYLETLQEVITGLVVQGQVSGQLAHGDSGQLALLYLAALHGLAAAAAFIGQPAASFPDAESVLRILMPKRDEIETQ
jgi:AcrR family transcriptional regulator